MRYEISLPPGTKEEVIEWFEFMNDQNVLVDHLIKLVDQQVSYQHTEAANIENQRSTSMESDCLVDNLFNWQEANQLMLSDKKKPKKKMLMV